MRLMRHGVALFVILAFASGIVAGCATAERTSLVTIEETQQLFDAAKFTGAATKSPYEFYSAEIYLKKAIDEMNLGNTKKSEIYLNKAYHQAQIAYENAKRFERSQ